MKLISVKEAAEILGVNPSRVRQLILNDRIKSTLMGNTRIIMESDLKEFMTIRKSVGRPRKKRAEVKARKEKR